MVVLESSYRFTKNEVGKAWISARKRQIIRELAYGHTGIETGNNLNIAECTVKTHKRDIVFQSNAENNVRVIMQLIEQGIREEWIPTDGLLRFPRVSLTSREREVLELIRRGYVNSEIGKSLEIDNTTVKHYNKKVYEKLQARNRFHAAAIANTIKYLSEKFPSHSQYSRPIFKPQEVNPESKELVDFLIAAGFQVQFEEDMLEK